MKAKSELRTIRFAKNEAKWIDEYLKENPVFESFSSLARVATLSFIGEKKTVHLNPVKGEEGPKRPSFLWDYDLTEAEIRGILNQQGLSDQKIWLVARILKEARFEEVFQYLDVETIRKTLPQLRLPQEVKERWEYAVERWSKND